MKNVILAVGLSCSQWVSASVIDFTDTGDLCTVSMSGIGANTVCGNGSHVSQAYGDVVGKLNVTYSDLVRNTSLRWWQNDYNDLQNVVWGGWGDGAGQSHNQIAFEPLDGFEVSLTSISLGAYYHAVRSTYLKILDGNGTLLLDFDKPTVGSGDSASTFFINLVSSNGFIIDWRDTGTNVGIDNITFDVSPHSVPEPGGLGLLAIGLAYVGYLRRSEIRELTQNLRV